MARQTNSKLNRPWTGPWRIIKRLGQVVYHADKERRERKGWRQQANCSSQSIKAFSQRPRV